MMNICAKFRSNISTNYGDTASREIDVKPTMDHPKTRCSPLTIVNGGIKINLLKFHYTYHVPFHHMNDDTILHTQTPTKKPVAHYTQPPTYQIFSMSATQHNSRYHITSDAYILFTSTSRDLKQTRRTLKQIVNIL